VTTKRHSLKLIPEWKNKTKTITKTQTLTETITIT
jgi:hypothetical protein